MPSLKQVVTGAIALAALTHQFANGAAAPAVAAALTGALAFTATSATRSTDANVQAPFTAAGTTKNSDTFATTFQQKYEKAMNEFFNETEFDENVFKNGSRPDLVTLFRNPDKTKATEEFKKLLKGADLLDPKSTIKLATKFENAHQVIHEFSQIYNKRIEECIYYGD